MIKKKNRRIRIRPTLGWPKSLYVFFCKIKGTLFIFTNNFIDVDILSMLAISRVLT